MWQLPSPMKPLSRISSWSPLAYRQWIAYGVFRPMPSGTNSTGVVSSVPAAHWHKSTVCEPHSRMPPPWKSKYPRQRPRYILRVVRPPRRRTQPAVPIAHLPGGSGSPGSQS